MPLSPQEIRMSVACLHELWLGHFARSPLRRDVAFSPLFLHHACVYPQLDIKGASICCRERGHVRIVTKQRPRATCLPFIKLGIEF
jgi:hypothetical protein